MYFGSASEKHIFWKAGKKELLVIRNKRDGVSYAMFSSFTTDKSFENFFPWWRESLLMPRGQSKTQLLTFYTPRQVTPLISKAMGIEIMYLWKRNECGSNNKTITEKLWHPYNWRVNETYSLPECNKIVYKNCGTAHQQPNRDKTGKSTDTCMCIERILINNKSDMLEQRVKTPIMSA